MNISLVVCNATVQMSGYYTCMHEVTNSPTVMNITVIKLSVNTPSATALPSVDVLEVTVSVAVGLTLILILGAAMLCTVVCVRMCYGREKVSAAFRQINVIDIATSKDMKSLDLSDGMEFPRKSLEFVSLLGK